MLRSIMEQGGKSAPSYRKIAANAKTGMGATISGDTRAFPTAATTEDIYMLQKSRVLNGRDAVLTEEVDDNAS